MEDVSGAASAAGVPGTASNLPRPTSRPGTATSGLSRRTENISYQSSRVVRRVKLPQGSIKCLAVSVVVDHVLRWEGSGPKARRIVEPPPPERMKAIQDLVAAAVGLQPLRGDQLVVESLPFDATLNLEAPAIGPAPAPSAPGGSASPLNRLLADRTMQVIAVAAGVLILLLAALGFFVRRKKHRHAVELSAPRELPAATAQPTAESLPELPPVRAKRSDLVTERFQEMVSIDAAGSEQVLRTCLSE